MSDNFVYELTKIIMFLDGVMGTMIQRKGLSEADFSAPEGYSDYFGAFAVTSGLGRKIYLLKKPSAGSLLLERIDKFTVAFYV